MSGIMLSGYLLSAIASLVLAGWLMSQRAGVGAAPGTLAAALALTALWTISVLAYDAGAIASQLLFIATSLAWLGLLYRLFVLDGRHASLAPIKPVVAALAFVALLQIVLLLAVAGIERPAAAASLMHVTTEFRLLFCAGALVLVHNLYIGASSPTRTSLRWPAAALAVLWAFDFNYYTVSYLIDGVPVTLDALRGCVPLVMIALFAIGTMAKDRQQAFRPSRSFAFQSFSLLLIAAYFLVMVAVFKGLTAIGGDFVRLVQIAFVAIASALAIFVLPSRNMRGWLRVTAIKHLFQHRYDYREEWLRFTRTMGRAGPGALPLPERVVQAVADVTDSPGGLLLTPADDSGLTLEARWQWPGPQVPAQALDEAGARFFTEAEFILDLDQWRAAKAPDVPRAAVPAWIAEEPESWCLVPLLHYERLVGIVVLARPPHARKLDWEDFDLLRVVGRQLASYLAEHASQIALGEAQRFDEFNRRIAFVMHDIKNLASQFALLARNAEKHADKPDFRADMLVTLRNSSDKLNALLARLGRYGAQAHEAMAPLAIGPLLQRIAMRYRSQHQLTVIEAADCTVFAQAEALEQALVHLVQNAIEVSKGDQAVLLSAKRLGNAAVIEVTDSGPGMSPEFVRSRLFKPFHSSKPGGFGIGAFEAREIVRTMGGRLEVESHEGLGSRFIVRLPLAEAAELIRSMQKTKEKVA